MKVTRYRMPAGAATNDAGRLSQGFQHYLAGLEDVSGRVTAKIDPLDGAATLADVIAKVNEIIAAMQAARAMESE